MQQATSAPVSVHSKEATTLVVMQIRTYLCPGELTKVKPEVLTILLQELRHHYVRSLIAYGMAVGIDTAMGIGSQFTQYMLDAHHHSVKGGTSRDVAMRPQEIFNLVPVERESNPQMLLEPHDSTDKAQAMKLANMMEFFSLRDFAVAATLLAEGPGTFNHPEYKDDKEWIEEFYRHRPLVKTSDMMSVVSIRVVLNLSLIHI